MKSQRGFTLIELMVVIVVVGILAAIAVPTYRQYAVKNNESLVQSRMMTLQTELDRWRASVLSYRGFTPSSTDNNGNRTYQYSSGSTKINVPNTQNAQQIKYVITLVNGAGQSLTTNVVNAGGVNITTAQNATSWVMVAHPTSQAGVGARTMLMKSDGQRCMSVSAKFCEKPSNACQCTNKEESW